MLTPIEQEDIQTLRQDLASLLPKFAGTTVLVTGASGFLCSPIVDLIAAANDAGLTPKAKVIALDNHKTGRNDVHAHLRGRSDVVFANHDISKPYVPEGPVDWILHGASIASPPVYRQYPLETIEVNVWGTRHMLDLALAKRAKGVVIFSTSEIYGDPPADKIPTAEDYRGNVSCTGPRACYDESKRLAETLAVTYHGQKDVPAMCIRPFNVYGPGLRLDDGRILPDLLSKAMRQEDLVLFSDGKPTRSFCYVTDALGLILRILVSGKGGEAFNIGNDREEVSMASLAQKTADAAHKILSGASIKVTFKPSTDPHYLTDNPQRRCPDLKKVNTHFPDWSPKIMIAQGLERLIQHHAAAMAKTHAKAS